MIRNLVVRSAAMALALASVVVAVSSAKAASDPWAKGAQWMSIRGGYVKATGKRSADGGAGYGFGYSRMLNKKYSLGFYVHHEVVQHANAASEMAFPMTAELVRHYDWHTAVRPYVGLGGGPFNWRTTRSGDDGITQAAGYYVVTGMNSPLNAHQVLGFDARVARLNGDTERANPVFGAQENSLIVVSLKLNWSYTY